MNRILIAEDDKNISRLEKDYLETNDFYVDVVHSGTKAVECAIQGDYDLVILDLMLPGCDGYQVCKKIRDKINIPIIMVTAKTDSIDVIKGLGLGADDYITKPFDPAQLVARVKSHLRRYDRLVNSPKIEKSGDYICVANLKIMVNSWKVYKDGQEIKLPNKEFELLRFLAENPDTVFSKEQLFQKIWAMDYAADTATVSVHINRIREKIEKDARNPVIIETVWGVGYKLNSKKL